MTSMRKIVTTVQWFLIAALCTFGLVPAGPAIAQIGYTTGGIEGVVRSGSDQCVHSGAWNPTMAVANCELDSDEDGVPDSVDECPNTPKGWPVDARGCPLDSDGDGVPDGGDKCPNTPAGVEVNADGCPLDSDGDGVPDYRDKCPETARGLKVDADGCPLDSDGDGVPDNLDACPNTPPGVKVDSRGCVIKSKFIIPTAFFELNSAEIKEINVKAIEVTASRIQERRKDVKSIVITGFTDSTGSREYNQRLSERRAASVRDFLVSRGISEGKMSVRGMGELQPVADNNTEEGRAANRRVEINVFFESE